MAHAIRLTTIELSDGTRISARFAHKLSACILHTLLLALHKSLLMLPNVHTSPEAPKNLALTSVAQSQLGSLKFQLG